MMIKRLFALLLVIVCTSLSLYSDWMSETSDYLCRKNDYQGAVDYLVKNLEKIEEVYKPTVCGLLAYSFHKLNDRKNEWEWISEYFETYWGSGTLLSFLDVPTQLSIAAYLRTWERRYPLITEIALVSRKITGGSTPPAELEIGIDITNGALYKLADEKGVIEGGLFKEGFNSIHLGEDNLFDESGTHVYFLDVKTEDIVLRKEIEIDIQLDTPRIVKKRSSETRKIEYKLSMFIGDRLIVSSQKYPEKKLSMNFKKTPLPINYKPYLPPNRSDPFSQQAFSILDAVGAAVQLINRLNKKKSAEKPKTYFQKRQQMTRAFVRKDAEGVEREVKATIQIRSKNLKIPNN